MTDYVIVCEDCGWFGWAKQRALGTDKKNKQTASYNPAYLNINVYLSVNRYFEEIENGMFIRYVSSGLDSIIIYHSLIDMLLLICLGWRYLHCC